jgi:hypothetical protein
MFEQKLTLLPTGIYNDNSCYRKSLAPGWMGVSNTYPELKSRITHLSKERRAVAGRTPYVAARVLSVDLGAAKDGEHSSQRQDLQHH